MFHSSCFPLSFPFILAEVLMVYGSIQIYITVVLVQVKHSIMSNYHRKKIFLSPVWKSGHSLIKFSSLYFSKTFSLFIRVCVCVCVYISNYLSSREKKQPYERESSLLHHITAINCKRIFLCLILYQCLSDLHENQINKWTR